MKSFKELSALVKQWAADKDILRRDASPQQYLKILEETGETAAAILRNQPDKIKDGIGDMAVTMIIYAAQKGVAMEGRGKGNSVGSDNFDTQKAFQNFLEYINGGFFLYAYDMLVILAAKHSLTLEECLEAAWNEIKDRKGKTVNNVFVKDEVRHYKAIADPDLIDKFITKEMFPANDVQFQKAEALVVGKVYADSPVYNENTVLARLTKDSDNLLVFEHVHGPRTYVGLNEVFFIKDINHYEVPDDVMKELGLKHEGERQP